MPFPAKGYIVICSDGLWGLVTDEEISRLVVHASSLDQACQDLLTAANAAGGSDNISVIIVQSKG
jgi:protein phosphatase